MHLYIGWSLNTVSPPFYILRWESLSLLLPRLILLRAELWSGLMHHIQRRLQKQSHSWGFWSSCSSRLVGHQHTDSIAGDATQGYCKVSAPPLKLRVWVYWFLHDRGRRIERGKQHEWEEEESMNKELLENQWSTSTTLYCESNNC